jgi:hypothetical protein
MKSRPHELCGSQMRAAWAVSFCKRTVTRDASSCRVRRSGITACRAYQSMTMKSALPI